MRGIDVKGVGESAQKSLRNRAFLSFQGWKMQVNVSIIISIRKHIHRRGFACVQSRMDVFGK